MNLIIELVIATICVIPLHELGHYIAARLNGWHNIEFSLAYWHSIPIAFAVSAKEHIPILDAKSFKKAYFQLTRFSAMGSIFSIVSLSIFSFLGLLESHITTMFVLLFAIYMIWELTNIPVAVDTENELEKELK
jgi:hypothetical protein